MGRLDMWNLTYMVQAAFAPVVWSWGPSLFHPVWRYTGHEHSTSRTTVNCIVTAASVQFKEHNPFPIVTVLAGNSISVLISKCLSVPGN